MKIVIVGVTGTIGKAVAEALRGRHEVIGVHRHGNPPVNLEKPETVATLFDRVGAIEAIVCCAGGAAWKPFADLTDADFEYSLHSKLMGQVNLARIAMRHLCEGGSITLTSGILAQRPMAGSGAVSLVNSALEGFGRAAALEAPRGIRVNVVSPPWVAETLQAMGKDPSTGLSAAVVAASYVGAIEGTVRGEILYPAPPV